MKVKYEYDIFPRTWLPRVLLGLAFAGGLAAIAGWLVVSLISLDFFNLLDEVEVTVDNRTERLLTIYVSGQSEAVVTPGDTTTFTTPKIGWKFGGVKVQAVDFNGVVVFEEDIDLDELERMDYRIVIEPVRLVVEPVMVYPPCTGPGLEACLEAQTQLEPYARDGCEGEGRRLCLLPLGAISTEVILGLAAHYEDEYGIEVGVLAPKSIPMDLVDFPRGQIDAATLVSYVNSIQPDEYRDGEVVLIAVTPADLYSRTSSWRFLFGLRGTFADPHAVVSTFRMDPQSFGEPPDDEITLGRARKLTTKYIGLLYYDLPASDDPKSPMFDNILSVSDLERMEEPLTIPAQP